MGNPKGQRGQFSKDDKREEVKISVPESAVKELNRAAIEAGESRALFIGRIVKKFLDERRKKK